jgi:hypothetical protein
MRERESHQKTIRNPSQNRCKIDTNVILEKEMQEAVEKHGKSLKSEPKMELKSGKMTSKNRSRKLMRKRGVSRKVVSWSAPPV